MPKSKNKDILDVIEGISQVLMQTYDGARDKDGEPIKVGLKRENGSPCLDSRIMDGFKARVQGENLIITYQSEILLKDVHDKKFEENLEQMIENISKYIKKEYKNITGQSLTLTKVKEIPMKAIVQRTSNIRVWVQSTCAYKIGGIDLKEKGDVAENNFREWLKQTSKEAKRPKNEYIKKEDNQKEEKKD